MKIESLQELKKLIQLCYAQNIQAIKIDNIELALGSKPQRKAKSIDSPKSTLPTYGEITADDKIITQELTEEQILMWSVQDQVKDQ